ncbi:MAG: zf-HC2 domain-containing protein [Candidatus Omnitrophica bacterium]|nr:zf-HC2 domain-containing protein [Candidatus Omnitrophota bacterium]
MNCNEIKKLLSEYIDGALEADEKAVVEEHLASCEKCSEEAALLKACVEKIGSLEKIEAPEEFLKKVKERVERRSVFQEMMRGLFVPVRIKIPLELAGVAVSVVLVILILNTTQPQKQIASLPQPTDSMRAPNPTWFGAGEGLAGKRPEEDSIRVASKEVKKPPLVIKEELLSYSRGVLEDEKDSRIRPEEKPIELALLIRPKDVGSKGYSDAALDSSLAGFDYDGYEEIAPAPGSYLEQSIRGDHSAIDKADLGLAVVDSEEERQKEVALSDIQKSYLEIKKLVEIAKGEIISVSYNENTNEPQAITINLPVENSSLFLDNLNQLGELQSPPSFAPAEGERLIRLRIQLIPAN